MSSGSDGLYLSPLSDMSPATSDCLEPYFSGEFYVRVLFSNYRVCEGENRCQGRGVWMNEYLDEI